VRPDHREDALVDESAIDAPIALGVQAPRAARRIVGRLLCELLPPALVERAQLVVSELVTNSLRHSGAADGEHVVLRVRVWRGGVRLEVEDPGCDTRIAPRAPDLRKGGGMGLHLVDSLSQAWGVVLDPDGPTRVWAQLPPADEETEAATIVRS
jgi:serine/threonine-protein kinase RsbW